MELGLIVYPNHGKAANVAFLLIMKECILFIKTNIIYNLAIKWKILKSIIIQDVANQEKL